MAGLSKNYRMQNDDRRRIRMRQKVTVQPRLKRGEFFAAFPQKERLVRQKRRHSVPCSNLQKTENRVKLIHIAYLYHSCGAGTLTAACLLCLITFSFLWEHHCAVTPPSTTRLSS